jgi:hypothetical protein
MDQLTKQVKGEMLRTLIWFLVAMGISVGIYLMIWR